MRRGPSDERGPLWRGQLETQSGSLLERIRRGRAAALPEFEGSSTCWVSRSLPRGPLVDGSAFHAARHDDDLAADMAESSSELSTTTWRAMSSGVAILRRAIVRVTRSITSGSSTSGRAIGVFVQPGHTQLTRPAGAIRARSRSSGSGGARRRPPTSPPRSRRGPPPEDACRRGDEHEAAVAASLDRPKEPARREEGRGPGSHAASAPSARAAATRPGVLGRPDSGDRCADVELAGLLEQALGLVLPGRGPPARA